MRTLVTLALFLGLAGPAGAITAERTTDEYGNEMLQITAAEGEANRFALSEEALPDGRSRVTATDTGAPIVAGPGCTLVDQDTVQCETGAKNRQVGVRVALGDLDDTGQIAPGFDLVRLALDVDMGPGQDRIYSEAEAFSIRGGLGADRLTGGPGRQWFYGNGGNDLLEGGEGDDYLRGDGGDDEMRGGPGNDGFDGGFAEAGGDPLGTDRFYGEAGDDTIDDMDPWTGQFGPDLVDGGPGSDTVSSYRDTRSPVRVDLEQTTGQGHQGENDTLIDVENVRGGAAADTLLGNDEANHFLEAWGDDVVAGRGGDDRIYAAAGAQVSAGSGDDEIRMWPTFAGSIKCESGRDVIHFGPYYSGPFPGFPDPRARGMLVGRDCERMRYRTFEFAPVPQRKKRRLTFRFSTYTCCRKPLSLFVAGSGSRIGTRRIGSPRVEFRHPRRRGRATLRAVFRPRSDIPIVWRFRR